MRKAKLLSLSNFAENYPQNNKKKVLLACHEIFHFNLAG